MEENPHIGLANDDDEDIEYDEDGNAIIPEHKRVKQYSILWLTIFKIGCFSMLFL